MKRLHVHMSVENLDQSIRFYTTLFATEPTVVKPDYAKWMLEDPRVNFAISTHNGRAAGLAEDGTTEPPLAVGAGAPVAAQGQVVAQRAADHLSGRAEGIGEGAARRLAAIDTGFTLAADGSVPAEGAVRDGETRRQEFKDSAICDSAASADPVECITPTVAEAADGLVAGKRSLYDGEATAVFIGDGAADAKGGESTA